MWESRRISYALCGWMIATASAFGANQGAAAESRSSEPRMPAVIEQFTADSMALDSTYPVAI